MRQGTFTFAPSGTITQAALHALAASKNFSSSTYAMSPGPANSRLATLLINTLPSPMTWLPTWLAISDAVIAFAVIYSPGGAGGYAAPQCGKASPYRSNTDKTEWLRLGLEA